MKLYTINDLNRGAGIFDHVMRVAGEYPSYHTQTSREVAIGILAAAMKSGLKNHEMDRAIEDYFDENTSALLRQVRAMYDGNDPRVHLWERKGGDRYELTDRQLKSYVCPHWRVKESLQHDW